jgi:hypothetical protein
MRVGPLSPTACVFTRVARHPTDVLDLRDVGPSVPLFISTVRFYCHEKRYADHRCRQSS